MKRTILTKSPSAECAGLPTSTPAGCAVDDSVSSALLQRVASEVGRKALAHRLHVSKSLLDQWLSGEKASPLARTADVIAVMLELRRPDLALAAVQEFCELLGGAAVSAEQLAVIKEIGGVRKI